MRWNTGKYTIIEVHRAQELEPVEQPVRRGGVVARLNPAQPDEAADRPRQHLGSQSVEPITSQAAKSLPRRKVSIGGAKASIAIAVI